MSSINRLFKHTFVYGLATVLPRLLTVLLTLLLTEYLPSKTAFGEVSIIFSWIILANVILTYGMETAFFRFRESEDDNKVISTGLISLLVTTTAFVVIAFLGLDQIAAWSGKSADYWKWVIGILAFDTLMVIPFAWMRAQGKAMKYAVVKMINVIISVGMTAIFLIWLPDLPALAEFLPTDKVELYFIALMAASAFTLLVVCRIYFRKWEFDAGLWKQMLRYGFPILIAGIAFAINETFDKILLEWLLPEDSTAQVGVYTACYRVAVGMTLFATAFKLGIEPFFFSESKSENATATYAMITKMFVVLGSIALISYTVFIDVIKRAIIAEEYWEALDIVPVVLVAYLFFGIYQTLSVWYKVTDRTSYGAYISVLGAVITIGFNIWLIPIIGYMASALTTCAAYGLMMVVSYLLGRKHYHIPYEVGNMLLYLVISIGSTALFFYGIRDYFGPNTWQMYLSGIALAGLVSLFILSRERTFIKSLLKKS
ncbi:Membrane protein involved in the export of O-antigen and teichoic acid [Nonlabens sp. Hel1_33_55]|uniref:lipopolysaccharide biosynthesis protein n=1 Tax=Nonlabens sp. Hel1_33_55 TaxID=1336802 RepID=UPI000875CF9C|nr:oligosaccharide flippase family protein [Nonlabens sp. Hel1_33_55]SCY35006.1 Membrane protein involved in the export of O-antigen and teichoic acid [Nonlabens sp. Hel1_33_55]